MLRSRKFRFLQLNTKRCLPAQNLASAITKNKNTVLMFGTGGNTKFLKNRKCFKLAGYQALQRSETVLSLLRNGFLIVEDNQIRQKQKSPSYVIQAWKSIEDDEEGKLHVPPLDQIVQFYKYKTDFLDFLVFSNESIKLYMSKYGIQIFWMVK